MTKTTKNIEILQKDNPVLRQISKPIGEKEIKSAKIKSLISDMKIAIRSQSDAIAVSAVQIGQPLRIFVVSNKLYEVLGDSPEVAMQKKDLIFINPVIKKLSKEKKPMEEGCLSVRNLYGMVVRSTKVSFEAQNENGQKISRGASGTLAQIIQHETDHLDGILFIDKATGVHEIKPENYNAL